MFADLLVVAGDPLAGIGILRDSNAIRRVVLNWRTVMDRNLSRFLMDGEVVNRAMPG